MTLRDRHDNCHRVIRVILVGSGLLTSPCVSADSGATASSPLTYPPTRTVTQVDTYHGVAVNDPYRWLEDASSPEVEAWARAQNLLTETWVGGAAVSEIAARIASYSAYTYANQHQVYGGRTYFLRGWSGSPYTGLYVRDADGRERHLNGPVIVEGGDPTAISSFTRNFWPSPDGGLVLVLTAQKGDNFGQLQLLEAASGKILAQIGTPTHTGTTSAAWLPSSTGFVYTRTDRQGERTAVSNRTLLYTVASGQESLLLAPIEDLPGRHKIQTAHLAVDASRLFVEVTSGASGITEIKLLDLGTEPPLVRNLFTQAARWRFIGARGGDAWFYTDAEAPKGRVVRLSDVAGKATLTTVVPEGSGAIAAGSQVGGDAYGLFGDYLVMLFQEADGPVIRAFDLAGKRVWERQIPPSGSLWGNFTGDRRTACFFYQFLGIADPATVRRVTLPDGHEEVVAAPKLPFAPGAFTAERLTVTARDGAKIPLLLAYRKDLPRDRPHRLILYGYGAFGWNSFLWYQPWLAEWFLTHNGVFAVAGIRGGGEQGAAWHEAGRRRNRQTAIDDYLTVGEWLITSGHTTATRLVANSSSLAGSLASVAITQRPELFAAATIDYPILDQLRYLQFGQARTMIEELGDPAEADDFAVLRRISPYHNVRDGQCAPPTLLRPGALDPVVTPVHSFKMAARLQAAQRCPQPILLDVMEGAGHDYGSTPQEIARNQAVALAFLDRVLAD